MSVKIVAWVAILGAVGCTLRFGFTHAMSQLFLNQRWSMVIGTLSVNIIGCFLMGLISAMAVKHTFSEPMRVALTSGLLGGFTTYSAFNAQTLDAITRFEWRLASLQVLVTLVFCLLGGYLGELCAK